MQLQRHPLNPIVIPGSHHWRSIVTFNPGVIHDGGKFYMLERAVSSLAPLFSHFGLLTSTDGVNFTHALDRPVFTAADLGTPRGTVEDPRLVKIDGTFYMSYVHRNYASSCFPNGKGIPSYSGPWDVPPGDPNNYRSGIATSTDLIHWKNLGLVTPPEVDDRDCVLFPEKIKGRFAMLRRPMDYVGAQYGCDRPSIWLSYSSDLLHWDPPTLVATATAQPWEKIKIGAAAPPLKTRAGWLTLYHGVDSAVTYRAGVMLLDLENPARIIARAPDFILEPQAYYERVGLIIPRVVFPSANVVHNGNVYIYYGCADTCISLATVPLEELLSYVLQFKI